MVLFCTYSRENTSYRAFLKLQRGDHEFTFCNWKDVTFYKYPITVPLAPTPEKAMAPHSSTLAWKIPWMEEPAGLQSMGSLRVGHDWATSLSLFTFTHWRRKWQPTPVFLPGTGEPGGLPSMGSHSVGHDWSDLAAAPTQHKCRFCKHCNSHNPRC